MYNKMGYDFSYQIYGQEPCIGELDFQVSRRNHYLREIVSEKTKFTYQELYEQIINMLKQHYDYRDYQNVTDIGEALRVLVCVFTKLNKEDSVVIDYC